MGAPQANQLADIGMLLTSHPGHWRWHRSCFDSLSGWPGFVWFGYDDDTLPDLSRLRASVADGKLLTHTTGKHWPSIGDVRGDLSLMKQGANDLSASGSKWIFKMSADTCLWRWRNFAIVKGYIENHKADIARRGTSYIFAKTGAFVNVMNRYNIGKYTGSCELFWTNTEHIAGIEKCGENTAWWEQTLGAIHMHGEWALNNGIRISAARDFRCQ